MKNWSILFGMLSGILISLSAQALNENNLNKQGIILDGYDPVSYFSSSGPTHGQAKIQAQLDGATYLFSSEENKALFLKDPKKYTPAFGGWCAYAVADSKSKVEVDPKNFLIQDGRLLLFYKGLWGDTREKWQHDKKRSSKSFLETADTNWPEVKPQEP